NEKLMIINVHNYFKVNESIKESYQKSKLCKRVAEVLGILEGTIGSVVVDWNRCGDSSFTPYKVLRRPILKPDENISELLHTKILNANKADCSETDRPNLPCKIIEKFRLQIWNLNISYNGSNLEPKSLNNLSELDNIPNNTISVREASRLQNIFEVEISGIKCEKDCNNPPM
ncbi:2351_t:CDS:2, partial [Funneliformis geosporum]